MSSYWHLADEFGAVGAQASDSVVDAFDCKHDAPEAQRVRRRDRRFDLDQFWITKLRQLEPPVPIRGLHHNDVDLDTVDPVDAVHPRALDRHLSFDRHAERGEKSDSAGKVVNDDDNVVQSLDRHVPSIAEAARGGFKPTVLASWMWKAEVCGEMRAQPSCKKARWMSALPMLWPAPTRCYRHHPPRRPRPSPRKERGARQRGRGRPLLRPSPGNNATGFSPWYGALF